MNWSEIGKLAKQWRDTSIYERADQGALADLYTTAYRHGSSFDHSDSWSALSYLRRVGTDVELRTARSDDFLVAHALFVAAFAFLKIVLIRARFYCVPSEDAEEQMEKMFSAGFISEPQPLTEQDSGTGP